MSYIEKLLEGSSLTEAQFDSLLLYHRVLSGELTLKEAAKTRARGPVSVGAYQRVVKQGLHNLRRAMITVLLGANTGLLKREELAKLIGMVSKSPGELPEEQQQAFVTLIYALVREIVM